MKQAMIVVTSVLLFVASGAGRAVAQDSQPTISLHTAARAGDIEQLKAHIANRANLDQQDQLGFTPIYCAVSAARPEAAQLLLEAGANPNGAGPSGLTALIIAASMGRKDLIDLLIANKAMVDARDRQQRTALHVAVYSGQLDAVKALVEAGADVNGGGRGQTPLSAATQANQIEIAAYLREKGGQETMQLTPYGADAAYEQTTPQQTTTYQGPAAPDAVQLDPNVVAEQMKQYEGLAPALAAVDANSANEQRAWTMRRLDNRTSMLGAVEKQFGQEMAFVKKIATEEKAEKTIKAIDDLTAVRTKRYEAIGDALREQRRETLQQSRTSSGTAYGGRGRGSYTTGGTGVQGGTTPYGNYTQPGLTALPGRAEPGQSQADQETQNQVQAWLNSNVGDKQALLDTTHNLDVAELSALQQVAMEEQAKKTAVAITGLMMVREQRIAKVIDKWVEDDERAARMQQRTGMQGTQGTQDPTAGRRGRRR